MRLGFPHLARYGLAVIALHNLEEALTTPAWLMPRLAQLEAQFGIRPLAEDTSRFYPGLVAATLVPAIWIAIASRAVPRSAGAYSILLLYGVFFANAIAPHILGAVLLGSYVPGLVKPSRSSFLLRSPSGVARWSTTTRRRQDWRQRLSSRLQSTCRHSRCCSARGGR